jgi:hypothetical protein
MCRLRSRGQFSSRPASYGHARSVRRLGVFLPKLTRARPCRGRARSHFIRRDGLPSPLSGGARRTAGERPGLFPGLFATSFGFMRVVDRFLFYGERLSAQPNRLKLNDLSDDFGCYIAGAAMLWKLGCTRASGASVSTIMAATARVRKVTARRSTNTAISTTAVMKNERWVATSLPESSR